MTAAAENSMRIFRAIVQPLLSWYARSARTMPWRLSVPDPYKTLVSEIMLQQTRVETVKPYFERFIRELPTISDLAAADEERLLKLWEGLGYYSRVRNLQKAAQKIVTDYGGKIPADSSVLLRLPGIGEYTAGAIASIAFGQPEPAVDGNVLRVFARLLDYHEDASSPDFRKMIKDGLKKVYPAGHCSDFTQSLMDLGAVICLPGHPLCPECPLSAWCSGFREGTAAALPKKKENPPRRIENKTVLILRSADGLRTALRKRSGKGVLCGLWEYPWLKGFLSKNQVLDYLQSNGFSPLKIRELQPCRHVFSHLEWHMNGWLAECGEEPQDNSLVWTDAQQMRDERPLPSAFRGFTRQISG